MGDDSHLRLGNYSIKIGSGATPRGGKESYKNSGISLIRSQNVYNHFFSYDGLAFIDDIQAEKLNQVIVETRDILLNITGDSVTRVCQVPNDVLPARVNQHVAIIRPDPEYLDPRFVYYFLASPQMQNLMLTLSYAGATRKALTKGMIEDFQIPALPLQKQKRIASILGALDDKIELNRCMNRTLEDMARTLFKSWFMDFDPVHAKMAGRQPAGMDAETAALFPDSFDGDVPAGWRVDEIGKVVTVCGGSTPSTKNKDYWEGDNYWATPKDLSGLQSPILIDTDRKITDSGVSQISSGVLPIGTLLMSSRAPIGYLAISEISVSINQGFIAMVCDGKLPNYYVLNWAEWNMEEIRSRANGTTFLEISKSNFRPMPVIVPTQDVLKKFIEQASPIYRKIAANLQESLTLDNLRDTLLPKLMSGEIPIGDLPTEIEHVV
jgi:type I restriction enzyme, S subunit